MSLVQIILEIGLVIFIAVCVLFCFGFSTRAADGIKSKTYDSDERLHKAHDYLTAVAIISGIAIFTCGVIIAGTLVLAVFFAPEEILAASSVAEAGVAAQQMVKGHEDGIEKFMSTIVWIAIVFLVAFVFTLAILCGIAVYEISLSSNRASVGSSYDYAIYATIAASAGVVPILIYVIVKLVHHIKSEKAEKEEQEKHAQLEAQLQYLEEHPKVDAPTK